MAKTTIEVEDETWVKVRQLALTQKRPVREVVNDALRALVWVKRKPRVAAEGGVQ